MDIDEIVLNAPGKAKYWSQAVEQYFDGQFLNLSPGFKEQLVSVSKEERDVLLPLSLLEKLSSSNNGDGLEIVSVTTLAELVNAKSLSPCEVDGIETVLSRTWDKLYQSSNDFKDLASASDNALTAMKSSGNAQAAFLLAFRAFYGLN
ncbi:hypothetical protein [Vibrio sp. 10N.239.312.D08]|uniref:hypothetical protein n=1 Tax=Vibrio sp. 10N.239.312.D08 TaxID=3229978 RepID=UPI00354ECDB0